MHILMGVLLWVLFLYYWHLVMSQPISDHTRTALIIVVSLVAFITIFDIVWVHYNMNLVRQDRRLSRPVPAPLPTTDFLGREFIAPDDVDVRTAGYIEVDILNVDTKTHRGGKKMFRAPTEVPEA